MLRDAALAYPWPMTVTLHPSGPEPSDHPAAARRAGPDRLLEAAECLVGGGRSRAQRFLDHLRARGTSLDDLWCMTDADGRLLASALAVENPGRTAMLFVSPPVASSRSHCIDLATELCEELDRRGVAMVQALLSETAIAERQVLHGAGFHDLAVLISMERPLPRRGDITAPPLPPEAEIVRWDRTDRATLIRVLDASYEETLDCPGLCGLRSTEDILDGHINCGQYEPQLWSLLRLDGEAVGAVLLNANGDAIELVYLGLAPTARGRRLGGILLRRALAALVGRRERFISLAVDRKNEPALRLYRSLGFVHGQERLAMIRPLRP